MGRLGLGFILGLGSVGVELVQQHHTTTMSLQNPGSSLAPWANLDTPSNHPAKRSQFASFARAVRLLRLRAKKLPWL